MEEAGGDLSTLQRPLVTDVASARPAPSVTKLEFDYNGQIRLSYIRQLFFSS